MNFEGIVDGVLYINAYKLQVFIMDCLLGKSNRIFLDKTGYIEYDYYKEPNENSYILFDFTKKKQEDKGDFLKEIQEEKEKLGKAISEFDYALVILTKYCFENKGIKDFLAKNKISTFVLLDISGNKILPII